MQILHAKWRSFCHVLDVLTYFSVGQDGGTPTDANLECSSLNEKLVWNWTRFLLNIILFGSLDDKLAFIMFMASCQAII